MSKIRGPWALAVSMVLLAFSTTVLAHAQEPGGALDATLYTTYGISSNLQSVSWIVCGSTQQSSGCYSAGNLGPFVGAGALLESQPLTQGNTVTRAIYVVDTGSANNVKLYVYKKIDTITPDFDSVSVMLAKTVSLPLIGGPSVLCSMAANGRFLFIGTDQSPQAVRVQKSNLSMNQVGGFSPPLNVTAITSNSYGYVTVTQGGFGSAPNGFYVFGPDGNISEDGGGAQFMLETRAAVVPSTLPKSDGQPTKRLGYGPKK